MEPMRAPSVLVALLLAAVALVVGARGAAGKGGAPKEASKPPEWTEEDGRTVLRVSSPRPLKAYFRPPATPPEEGKKGELIVILHGHGGTATGMLGHAAMIGDPRGAFVLACEGSGTLQTDRGEGHSWDGADVAGILACLDAALAKHPVDPKRVIIMGHSAGGTMTLATYAARPSAFVGLYTTAAPRTPDASVKGARAAVCIGTKDPNFAGFPAAVAAAEKTVVGRCLAVEGLGHDLPPLGYAQEMVAWVMDSKGGSDVLHVPGQPEDEVRPPPDSPAAKAKGKGFRHVLVFEQGGRGAPPTAPPRPAAKAKATEAAASWKATRKGAPTDDPGEAVATLSEDPLTKETRGVVTGLVLCRYGGALVAGMSKLKGGDVSAPVESDAGWHVVARDPE